MKEASKGLEVGLKGTSRELHLRNALKGLEGSLKGTLRELQGGLKSSALKENLKRV